MNRILVTGATGFIGTHLVRRLNQLSYQVLAISSNAGDIADEKTLTNLPELDMVFHLAGRTYVPESWAETTNFVRVNVDGTANVLEFCRARKAHLVFLSAYIYGIPARLPIAESDPIRPNNPYALSKHLAEQICEFYATYRGVKVTVLRPFNVFGPGQQPKFLIPEIVAQVKSGKEICVKDLTPRRDYIYIDSLVDALVKALRAPEHFDIFNIGSGISFSVKEIIDIVQEEARTALPVISEFSTRPQEIPDVTANISRAKDIIGWVPTCSFMEGIRRLLKEDRYVSG